MMKLYKTKSAKDISLSYQIAYVLGLGMIVAYGFGRWLWPVYIPATMELAAAIVVFSMKIHYDWQDRKRDTSKDAGASPEVEVEVASAVSRNHCDDVSVALNDSCTSRLVSARQARLSPTETTAPAVLHAPHPNQTPKAGSSSAMTNMDTFFDTLGLVGSFLVSAALVPQIIKVYRSKSAKDISKAFQSVFVVGIACITVYGMGEGLWPIWIPSTLELLGGVILLTMKHYYDWRDAKHEEQEQQETFAAVAAEEAILNASSDAYRAALTPRSVQ
ncbi:unnamed protein product [Phytophthora lilii]|uniref:Unnamed protein product n=1 Tax=Phytophthora lilii TaxID=2077276 RepID=A0A9W6TCR8_9STRA|nr:unnamed protein product [Phytophthora lilii]